MPNILIFIFLFIPTIFSVFLPPSDAQEVSSEIISSLEIMDQSLSETLNILSEKTGLIVTNPQEHNAKVSISLHDVPLNDALRIILEPHGLCYFEIEPEKIKILTLSQFKADYGYSFQEDVQTKIIPLASIDIKELQEILAPLKSQAGRIYLDEKRPAIILIDGLESLLNMSSLIRDLDVPMETEIFDIQKIDPVQIMARVKRHLTPNLGQVEYDTSSNSLIVTDSAVKIAEISEELRNYKASDSDDNIDIEVKVLQIALSPEHQEGIDWEAIVSQYQQLKFVDNQEQPIVWGQLGKPTEAEAQSNAKTLSIGIISDEDLAVLEEALDTVGPIHVISKSNITAQNDKVSFFTTRLERMPDQDDDKANLFNRTKEIQLYLSVTPQNGQTLSIHFKPGLNSEESAEMTALENDSTSMTEDANHINVPNNSTIVIGGLFKDVHVDSLKKVPLLGDLPFLGYVFRKPGKKTVKTEIVIFVILKKDAVSPSL